MDEVMSQLLETRDPQSSDGSLGTAFAAAAPDTASTGSRPVPSAPGAPTPPPTTANIAATGSTAVNQDVGGDKRRKIGRRACDGCKIRKIRCSELPGPCERCVKVGIACTFNQTQAVRGPRTLRDKTIRQIRAVQEKSQAARSPPPPEQEPESAYSALPSPVGSDSMPDSAAQERPGRGCDAEPMPAGARPEVCPDGGAGSDARTPTSTLMFLLYVYRLRLFPVWPIVTVREVTEALQRDPQDLETYALANAVGAATIAQLKLDRRPTAAGDGGLGAAIENGAVSGGNGGAEVSASSLVAECRRVQRILGKRNSREEERPSLNSLRISFFLHIYHENQTPGGARSLLFLREAITMAQIMQMDKRGPSSGPGDMAAGAAERRMMVRVLWLLFVTERGVAMLHGLPVVITCTVGFPPLNKAEESGADEDEAHILAGFKKLVSLFWIFDSSGAFDVLRDMGGIAALSGGFDTAPPSWAQQRSSVAFDADMMKLQNCFTLLRQQLGQAFGSGHQSFDSSDVQAADVHVTQLWMQAVIWKLLFRRRYWSLQQAPQQQQNQQQHQDMPHPFQITLDLLKLVGRLPATALESHGPGIELKIFEIASAVTDQLALSGSQQSIGGFSGALSGTSQFKSNDVLSQLQRILARCRGGNEKLLAMLQARVEGLWATTIPRSPGTIHRERAYDAYSGVVTEAVEIGGTLGEVSSQHFGEPEMPSSFRTMGTNTPADNRDAGGMNHQLQAHASLAPGVPPLSFNVDDMFLSMSTQIESMDPQVINVGVLNGHLSGLVPVVGSAWELNERVCLWDNGPDPSSSDSL